jgi:allantoinase
MSDLLVFVGNNVLLPGSESPVPATIEVSKTTGKITAIHERRRDKESYPSLDSANWVDADEQFILPGLVEYECQYFIIFCVP